MSKNLSFEFTFGGSTYYITCCATNTFYCYEGLISGDVAPCIRSTDSFKEAVEVCIQHHNDRIKKQIKKLEDRLFTLEIKL